MVKARQEIIDLDGEFEDQTAHFISSIPRVRFADSKRSSLIDTNPTTTSHENQSEKSNPSDNPITDGNYHSALTPSYPAAEISNSSQRLQPSRRVNLAKSVFQTSTGVLSPNKSTISARNVHSATQENRHPISSPRKEVSREDVILKSITNSTKFEIRRTGKRPPEEPVIESQRQSRKPCLSHIEASNAPRASFSHALNKKAGFLQSDHYINLDSDDDIDSETLKSGLGTGTKVSARCNSIAGNNEDCPIDVDFLDEEDKAFQEFVQEPISRGGARKPSIHQMRNPPIELPYIAVSDIEFRGMNLKPKKFVELLTGDFLHIEKVIKDCSTDTITLRGIRHQRNRDTNNLLNPKLNEICMVLELDEDDPRPAKEQSMVEIPVDQVVKLRNVKATNRLWPDGNWKDGMEGTKQEVEEKGLLVLRWKFTAIYPTARVRLNTINGYTQKRIEHFREKDVMEFRNGRRPSVTDEEIRFKFRGVTIPGGSYCPVEIKSASRSSSTVNLTETADFSRLSIEPPAVADSARPGRGMTIQLPKPPNYSLTDLSRHTMRGTGHSPFGTMTERKIRAVGQHYTVADIFCGAGGASRAAKDSGFRVMYGVDNWDVAGRSWKLNNLGAEFFQMGVDAFIKKYGGTIKYVVDVAHLSAPCVYWSPAHTVEGKHDPENQAILLCCGEMLKVLRPRIATLEQTFGILFPIHRLWFNSFINLFTNLGYSITWKVVKLENYGLASKRQRLIVYASCPGEALPEFPTETHAKDGANGLKPWTSVRSILSRIPNGAPHHQVRDSANFIHRKPAWDDSSIAPRCITTHGGQNYHPSGLRNFTVAEYAVLNGFPLSYRFCAPYLLRQIGNAVPPFPGNVVLFKPVMKALMKADNVMDDVIELDDDDTAHQDQYPIIIDNDEDGAVRNYDAIILDDDDDHLTINDENAIVPVEEEDDVVVILGRRIPADDETAADHGGNDIIHLD